VQVGGTLREKDTKTHQSRRIALDEPTVVLLRQHRLRQRELALALGAGLADDALLFVNAEGQPWRPDVCTNRFGRLRAKLGLGHVRLHDLRHFVATSATSSANTGHRVPKAPEPTESVFPPSRSGAHTFAGSPPGT